MSKLDDDIKETRLALRSLAKAHLADIAKLEEENADSEKIGEAYGRWQAEGQFDEEKLESLVSRKLIRRADKFDVPLPALPKYKNDDPHWDESEHWRRSAINGSFILTQQGRNYVDEAIWKIEERIYNRWSRWATLGIGLIGTITGLVSVTASNWEKFAAMFARISSLMRR
jgi:hypothetical protein